LKVLKQKSTSLLYTRVFSPPIGRYPIISFFLGFLSYSLGALVYFGLSLAIFTAISVTIMLDLLLTNLQNGIYEHKNLFNCQEKYLEASEL
jgi:low affinity Fe/Cu permease